MNKKLLMSSVALAICLNTSSVMAVNTVMSQEDIANIKMRNVQINAHIDEFEMTKKVDLSASGIGIRDAAETSFAEKYQEQVRRFSNPTLGEKAYDVITGTAIASTNAALNLTKWGAEKTFRYGAAYLTSYYSEELALQGVALGAGAAVTAVTLGNFTAGKLAYDGVLTLSKVAKYIPGGRGALAMAVTPPVKIGTDLVIDYGPRTVVTTAKLGYKAASKFYSGVSSVYSGVSSFAGWMSGY